MTDKPTNMTLLLRLREDINALKQTECKREDVFLRHSHFGYINAINDLLDRLFGQLQGYEVAISQKVLSELSFPLTIKDFGND